MVDRTQRHKAWRVRSGTPKGDIQHMDTAINTSVLHTLPVLPLKNTVLFPYLFVPLSAGRAASVAAVEAALASEDKTLVLLTQRNASVEQPASDDLYTVGT